MLGSAVGGRAAEPASKPAALAAGTHRRELVVGGRKRSYLVHVPKKHDAATPTPVVLAFHGAMMNGGGMDAFSGLTETSEKHGFIVAYGNGTGAGEMFLFWNASAPPGADGDPPDDVAYTVAMLDDLSTVANVDAKRVFATGMSNGGMMCHRLAAELSDRIAAIAPVGGTLALDEVKPKRPVPVMQFHGVDDTIVPFDGPRAGRTPRTMRFKSVPDTIAAWVKANGCDEKPTVTDLPDEADDGLTSKRHDYTGGRGRAEVVLIETKGGGHTWPGRKPVVGFIGKSTTDFSANELMWAFFQKHSMR